VASHWYGITDAEKEEIARNALKLTKSGRLPDEPHSLPPLGDIESKHESEKVEDAGHE
jgi:hypothetical protein